MAGKLEKVRNEKGSLIGFSIVYSTEAERNELFEKFNMVENFGRCLTVKVRIHNKNCPNPQACAPEMAI